MKPSLSAVNKLNLLMPKTKKSSKEKSKPTVDPKVGNYEKHPFFVKKANEAKALLKSVGLPKKMAKAK